VSCIGFTCHFVINIQTARAIRIEAPPGVLSIADDAIERAFFAALQESGGVRG